MIEFFTNIWNWIMQYKQEIVLYLSSGQFALLLGQIVVFIKTIRSNKNNINVSKTLQDSISNSKSTKDKIEDTANNTKDIKDKQEDIERLVEEKCSGIIDKVSSALVKIDAMLDVQSIVYSTIKDEKVRNNVNNILTTAKYTDAQTRADLKRQVEDLKAQIADKVKEITDSVEKTTESVSNALDGKNVNEEPMRY